jgi:hypothetical protein
MYEEAQVTKVDRAEFVLRSMFVDLAGMRSRTGARFDTEMGSSARRFRGS